MNTSLATHRASSHGLTSFRPAALILGLIALITVAVLTGCQTKPVVIKTLQPTAAMADKAIEGPVFYMPNTEFVVTLPLDVYLVSPAKGETPIVEIYAAADPKRLISMSAESVADRCYPLVAQTDFGTLIDVTQFELKLDSNSVLKNFNLTTDDKTADTIASVVKLALTAATVVAETPRVKREGPFAAQVAFRISPEHVPLESPPSGTKISIEDLIKRTGIEFRELFSLQNPQFGYGADTIVRIPNVTVSRKTLGPLDHIEGDRQHIANPAKIADILKKGVAGIPYRIPADHFITFTSIFANESTQTIVLHAKSPGGQPLLVAPVYGRRFSKSVSAIEISPTGALVTYSQTSSGGATNLTSSASTALEAIKADKKAQAEAEAKDLKVSYSLEVKRRMLEEQRAALEDQIKELKAQGADTPTNLELHRQLRAKVSELDIVNIKIRALDAGVDI